MLTLPPMTGQSLATEDSPDPLAMSDSRMRGITPQKRKQDDALASPTIKRINSNSSFAIPKAKPNSGITKSALSSSNWGKVGTPNKNLKVYVEVPTLSEVVTPPSKRPKSSQPLSAMSSSSYRSTKDSVLSDSTKDGAGSDDESFLGSAMKSTFGSVQKGTAPRTGERDNRGPLEKLMALLEDIFEAEDSLPPDADASSIDPDSLSRFFSKLTIDFTRPLLNMSVITKLTKALVHVAHPTKRVRLSARDGKLGTPHHAGLLELEIPTLQRILKLLGRSVKLGEDVEPFSGPPASTAAIAASQAVETKSKAAKGTKKGGTKKKVASGKGKSQTPKDGEDGSMEGLQESGGTFDDLTDEDLAKLDRNLEIAKESVLAADSCLALLSGDKLPKQVSALFMTWFISLLTIIFPLAILRGAYC